MGFVLRLLICLFGTLSLFYFPRSFKINKLIRCAVSVEWLFTYRKLPVCLFRIAKVFNVEFEHPCWNKETKMKKIWVRWESHVKYATKVFTLACWTPLQLKTFKSKSSSHAARLLLVKNLLIQNQNKIVLKIKRLCLDWSHKVTKSINVPKYHFVWLEERLETLTSFSSIHDSVYWSQIRSIIFCFCYIVINLC